MKINDIIEIVNKELFSGKEFKVTDIGNIPIYLFDGENKIELECNGIWADADGKCVLLAKKS